MPKRFFRSSNLLRAAASLQHSWFALGSAARRIKRGMLASRPRPVRHHKPSRLPSFQHHLASRSLQYAAKQRLMPTQEPELDVKKGLSLPDQQLLKGSEFHEFKRQLNSPTIHFSSSGAVPWQCGSPTSQQQMHAQEGSLGNTPWERKCMLFS